MPAKKSTSKSKQSNSPMDQISELRSCIETCENKLSDAYIKAIGKTKKQQDTIKKKLNPLKAKLAQAKAKQKQARAQLKEKKSAANQNRVAKAKTAIDTIQEKIDILKAEQASHKQQMDQITEEYRYFIAKEKAVAQFDKSWKKSLVQKAKKPKKIKNKKVKSQAPTKPIETKTKSLVEEAVL